MENNILEIKIWEKPKFQVLASKFTNTNDECINAGKIAPFADGTFFTDGSTCGGAS